jgi:quinol monooxygenase YgiN
VIVKYTRYKIDDPRHSAFEKAYANAAAALTTSSHRLAYELSRCTDSPHHYVLRIEWDSEEGHLKGFRSSSEFKTFFDLVQPLAKDIEEMRHYNVLSANRKSR